MPTPERLALKTAIDKCYFADDKVVNTNLNTLLDDAAIPESAVLRSTWRQLQAVNPLSEQFGKRQLIITTKGLIGRAELNVRRSLKEMGGISDAEREKAQLLWANEVPNVKRMALRLGIMGLYLAEKKHIAEIKLQPPNKPEQSLTLDAVTNRQIALSTFRHQKLLTGKEGV